MLNIQDLQAGYQGRSVLNVPQLCIAAQARSLLFGPSGAGKTTLLYTIAGLGEYVEGRVEIDGRNIYAMSETARDKWRGENIGIVFQDIHLLKPLTVLQNVVVGDFVRGRVQNTAHAAALLEKLGIADLAQRSAARLSRGQAQRVAIARALYQRPKILLADEPTSSLDRAAATQVMDLLMTLSDDMGMTLIVSSHDDRITDIFDQKYVVGGDV